MASLRIPTATLFTHNPFTHVKNSFTPINPNSLPIRRRRSVTNAYKVTIENEGKITELEVEEDESILTKAIDSGMNIPHDCKLGVCMTCPAKLLNGEVDQSEGMLSDDVIERGYALLCVAYPKSDCFIKVIPEEELLSLQLATAND